MAQKHLTIDDIEKNITNLYEEIDKELLKKNINFYKTQPSSIKIKEIVTSNTRINFDKFLRYSIKNEEIDETIKIKLVSLYDYQDLLIKYLEEKDRSSYKETILYFKRKGYTWKQIHGLFKKANIKYSERHIRRIANGK